MLLLGVGVAVDEGVMVGVEMNEGVVEVSEGVVEVNEGVVAGLFRVDEKGVRYRMMTLHQSHVI